MAPSAGRKGQFNAGFKRFEPFRRLSACAGAPGRALLTLLHPFFSRFRFRLENAFTTRFSRRPYFS
jgi:hypothetical protein